MRRDSWRFSRVFSWLPRFRLPSPQTRPLRARRRRLSGPARPRSKRARTPPRSSSTRSRPSWEAPARSSRASPPDARLSSASRRSTRKQLAIARTALRASQSRVAELVRALYEQPGHSADPLAILLGAEFARRGSDGPGQPQPRSGREQPDHRADPQPRSQARRARHTARRPRGRADRTRRGRESARRAARSRRGRAGELRRGAAPPTGSERGADRRHPNTGRGPLRPVRQRCRRPRLPPSKPPSPARRLRSERSPPDARITVSSTGYALRGHTATGIPTGPGVVAVDPAVIPLGTRLTIPGYGAGVAADTGGNVRGNVIDLWFPTRQQALAWGRRTVTITLG